jgi:pilus assembly protein CpaC
VGRSEWNSHQTFMDGIVMGLRVSDRFWKATISTMALLIVIALPTMSSAQPAKPKPGLKQKVQDLVESVVTAELELEVTLHRSKILRMKRDIFRAAVADPSLMDFVAFGSQEIELIGKKTGTTTVTLWLGTENDSELLSMLVTVVKDQAEEDDNRLEYSELAQKVNEVFPNSRVQLIPIADKVILRGQAASDEEAAQILQLISGQSNGGNLGGRTNPFSGGRVAIDKEGETAQASLVNLLHVAGEKQVLLKVRIAELKRSGARELGADFDFSIKDFLFESALTGSANALLSGTFSESNFNILLGALIRNGHAKVLAEPNLVTLSGKEATFLSGGEFAVPTVVGVGGAQASTTSFKGFGTSLSFTPTVLDKDRIRLQVNPTFSTLNSGNSVGGIFGLDTRTVSTTVDLREGQVLAIAGLLQEQQRGDKSWLPIIGDIPGLNFLTATRSVSRDETELVILVTPELVSPMDADQVPMLLPGMEVTEPNDLDFFIHGDLEGRANCHHRSTVWPLYKSRLKRCNKQDSIHKSTKFFLNGLHGFTD